MSTMEEEIKDKARRLAKELDKLHNGDQSIQNKEKASKLMMEFSELISSAKNKGINISITKETLHGNKIKTIIV